jgi:hypothetical protein
MNPADSSSNKEDGERQSIRGESGQTNCLRALNKFISAGKKIKHANVHPGGNQGCQMVANQNLNLGKFWAKEWIMWVCFMVNWNILRPFVYILYPFDNIVVLWYIFSLFGTLYQEKSGNPGGNKQK